MRKKHSSILAVSFLLLFGEPYFLRNKLADKNVLKNHCLSVAEVFVKASLQKMTLQCNCFQTCILFNFSADFKDNKCLYFECTAATVFPRFRKKMREDDRKDYAPFLFPEMLTGFLLMALEHIVLTVG